MLKSDLIDLSETRDLLYSPWCVMFYFSCKRVLNQKTALIINLYKIPHKFLLIIVFEAVAQLGYFKESVSRTII